MKRAFLGSFALAALLGACSDAADPRPSTEVGSPVEANGTSMAELRSFAGRFDGFLADYTTRTTEELAAESELVVVGKLTGLRPGRILFAETMKSPEAAQALVLAVKVDQVVKGSQIESGDTVYVELPSGGRGVSEFQRALPTGAETALYLTRAQPEEGNFLVGDEGAGRPEGAQLWTPYTPQGFSLVSEQGTVGPLSGETLRGSELSDLLPPG